MTLRIVLDLADVSLVWTTAPDHEGEVRVAVEIGERDEPAVIHEITVDPKCAERARQIGALLIGMAEERDPTGLEIVRRSAPGDEAPSGVTSVRGDAASPPDAGVPAGAEDSE